MTHISCDAMRSFTFVFISGNFNQKKKTAKKGPIMCRLRPPIIYAFIRFIHSTACPWEILECEHLMFNFF